LSCISIAIAVVLPPGVAHISRMRFLGFGYEKNEVPYLSQKKRTNV
jgi:hypothetical protein